MSLLDCALSCWMNVGLIVVVGYLLWKAYGKLQTWRHRQFHDFATKVKAVPKTNLRVAIIGSGLSGISSMKSCLEGGITPVVFESGKDIGGFWRYKEDPSEASVYRSTHIDTSRDMNSYGDFPYEPTKPIVLHNSEVFQYLKDNVKEFDMQKYFRFGCNVTNIRPVLDTTNTQTTERGPAGMYPWEVTYSQDGADQRTEVFDGVLVCTGRHAREGYIPAFPGLSSFKGTTMHSSHYKYPQKHDLQGKNVVVVGVGNSGIDIVCEVSQAAGSTVLVSRSGAWIVHADIGEKLHATTVNDRFLAWLGSKLPWWVSTNNFEKFIFVDQPILNKHGLKPKHRALQQHLLVTGLHDPDHTLHRQLEAGKITVRKGIECFTQNGIKFTGETQETPVDVVIFATGFKQATNCVDPAVVDLRFEREGNDVMLYKYIFPIVKYGGLGFINFVQSASFMCAELQSRLFVRVLKGELKLPPLEEQRQHQEATRQALCAQYIDRQQLRIQAGMSIKYYDSLAKMLGCYPSWSKLLLERPTAIWAAWFTPMCALHYRLVGTGRLEVAEKQITDQYTSSYYGTHADGTKMAGPRNRKGISGVALGALMYSMSIFGVIKVWAKGGNVGGEICDKLQENLEYAKHDVVEHCLDVGAAPKDVQALA